MDLAIASSDRHSCNVSNATNVKACVVLTCRYNFPLGLRAKDTSFKHGVFLEDWIVNWLILSYESAPWCLSVVVEKVMELNHCLKICAHVPSNIQSEHESDADEVNHKQQPQCRNTHILHSFNRVTIVVDLVPHFLDINQAYDVHAAECNLQHDEEEVGPTKKIKVLNHLLDF